ncbi:S-adenosyl-L-methionine-dependent methyltransferase [Cyathus striatus]|nr:S-adenosyl-L-methionine-dependent methyltransferase [Cyathus striatus]
MAPAFLSPAVAEAGELRALIRLDDPTSWDDAWKANVIPWDSGDVQPPLKEAISGLSLPAVGRALVPGCGTGYDVLYIASTLGWETVGFDISETALQAAKTNLESKSNVPNSDKVKFQQGNFFTLSVPEDQKFDLVYDYTFFVAIPPTRRPDWGKKMADLIKPGGHLITLVFPIDPPTELGPPYFVRPEHYIELLAGNFEKVVDKEPETALPHHKGREQLVVWRRIDA